MQNQTLRRNTWIFMGFLLLAGAIHIFDNDSLVPSFMIRTVMFAVTSLIYMGLLIFWIQSVHTRLLPSRARTYIITSALLMILFLFLRALKYRMTIGDFAKRYIWYAYYLPITMIPTLFLMACIRIRRGGKQGKWDERLLLIPPGIFSALVWTNDLHHLVFRPKSAQIPLIGTIGTYTYGLSFYALYLCVILMTVMGVYLLIKETGQRNIRKSLPIAAALLLWLIMSVAQNFLSAYDLRFPYQAPEIHIFCLLLIFEICIRERLIPHNEEYESIFSALRQPALITDRKLSPVYLTAEPVRATKEQLEASLSGGVYPEPDLRLFGKAIQGGCAFWTADESALPRLNEELEEANATLSEENNVIEAEKELKEEKARVEARNRLYLEAAEQVYPTQKKIAAMLKEIRPGGENLRLILTRATVLNAYAKRRTNFVLAEAPIVTVQEMRLALEETARYLPYCGTEAYVDCSAAVDQKYADAMGLYDTFEAVVEALLPFAPPYLLIAYSHAGLRLMAEGLSVAALPKTAPPVQMETEENRLTLMISFRKGGTA